METGSWPADKRKEQILDVAQALFTAQGYDQTSIAEIIGECGIARGTLYHHFSSKEEILDSIIKRINNQILTRAREVAGREDLRPMEKLVLTFQALSLGDDHQDTLEAIHRPENALMNQKVQEMILEDFVPLLASIVVEGNDQGVFATPYPYEVMELLILYINNVFDYTKQDMGPEEASTKVQALLYNMDRLLGTTDPTLKDYYEEIIGYYSKNQ